MDTVPATLLPALSVTVSADAPPAVLVASVAGFIASLKATVITPPVTTLSALLVLVDTLNASALAAVETMVGSLLPPPQAVMAAAASEVTTHKYGLADLEKAFMMGLVQTDNLEYARMINSSRL
jgi:hypothetical protein